MMQALAGYALAALALLAPAGPVQSGADEPVIRVTLLGTGTPAVRPHRLGPATLVEAGGEKLLFDAGRGTTMRLQQMGVPGHRIDRLFVTHLHSDHVIGIPDLWLTGWVLGRHERPLPMYGPAGLEAMVRSLSQAYAYDIRIRQDAGPRLPAAGMALAVQELEPGPAYEANGVSVTAIDVDHGPIKPAFGYRIDYRGRSVVLSGDTRYSKNLIERSRNVDLLVHEVAYASEEQARNPFWRGVVSTHTLPQDVARVFSATEPGLAVLYHVIARTTDGECEAFRATQAAYAGDLALAHDLMRIDIGADGHISVHSHQDAADCRKP